MVTVAGADTLKCVAGRATLVRAKVVLSAPAVAVTLYEPAMPLAVKAGAVAMPLALVTTVALAANVPEAPVEGAVKVTLTPLSGLLPASATRTCMAVANCVFTVALCGVPAVAVIVAAVPAVLVRAKVVLSAPAVAVTLYEP